MVDFPVAAFILMSTEETALRFIRAAVAAQFHKNGCFEPFLWNSAIVTVRISTGAPQHSRSVRIISRLRAAGRLISAGNRPSGLRRPALRSRMLSGKTDRPPCQDSAWGSCPAGRKGRISASLALDKAGL